MPFEFLWVLLSLPTSLLRMVGELAVEGSVAIGVSATVLQFIALYSIAYELLVIATELNYVSTLNLEINNQTGNLIISLPAI